MNRKERKLWIKRIKPIIKEFPRLEKKYGSEETKYAMRNYLRNLSEENKKKKEIKRLQTELEELNKRKL